MQAITSGAAPVYFNEQIYSEIATYVEQNSPSSVVILTDDNTYADCLPLFLEQIDFPTEPNILVMPAGEAFKTMEVTVSIIDELSNLLTDRKALMINLGGGVVTDLGGFVASIYKRGITYINLPTSLLAMVDASVGGKTGVDHGMLKNQIGVINNGAMVGVDIDYLATLPENQMRSGFAEIIKHGLIANQDYWAAVMNFDPGSMEGLDVLIRDSVVIKSDVVLEDPTEKGLRKVLNFGHTLGHAIETYSLESDVMDDLLHGEAIAVGMVMETYLSVKRFGFPESSLYDLMNLVRSYYRKVSFPENALEEINTYMLHDKKNVGGRVNFVLLEDIGVHKLDQTIDPKLIKEAFEFYVNEL
ncbi:3-dehydroquinate synthase [Gilvibacter sp.]|uniref:3-dehydroquinate synthase n=1 Tax=Gilvibacter sp. TaxID=2729997 RepID=UPI0025C676BA|nr:3-dehydroquinate synthase [Gilvibacter sp.]NQX78236.1 3-dehydroquinate synthase [Gilvibacter sp.]